MVVPVSALTASPRACTLAAPGSIIVRKRGSRHDGVGNCGGYCGGAHRERGRPRTDCLGPPVVLVDSTGKVAARPLNETIMLVTIGNGVAAPALIRPIYGPDERIASGLATWQSGGSVLFTSSDCTTGARCLQLAARGRACGRAGSDSGRNRASCRGDWTCDRGGDSLDPVRHGCAPVTVRQNGLFPVLATVNLDTAYPPPLSFR